MPQGMYLSDDEGNEVLLPARYITQTMKPDDMLKVFVYRDSEDRPVCTTQQPLAVADEVAVLMVKEVTPIGAFLDWGLEKDLLVPFAELKVRLNPGDKVPVYVYLDRANGRMVASTNIKKYIKNKEVDLKPGAEVSLLVCSETEIGYSVVIENRLWGMLYKNEVFTKINIGDRLNGFVKKVRDDGKIDLALQKQGIIVAKDTTDILLEKLKLNKGRLPLHDGSSPEEIYAALGVSKKNFKKAVGMLYKQKKIHLGKDYIKLLQ